MVCSAFQCNLQGVDEKCQVIIVDEPVGVCGPFLVKNRVHGGAVACCFLMAHCMIQFVWTADQAKTPAGVVSVGDVSARKICEMSTLKHSWMILKACLTKVHWCMQCAIVSKE